MLLNEKRTVIVLNNSMFSEDKSDFNLTLQLFYAAIFFQMSAIFPFEKNQFIQKILVVKEQ